VIELDVHAQGRCAGGQDVEEVLPDDAVNPASVLRHLLAMDIDDLTALAEDVLLNLFG
jgi:hypothetical protein